MLFFIEKLVYRLINREDASQVVIPSSLLKVIIIVLGFSLVFGNSYISEEVLSIQKDGEKVLIKEHNNLTNLDDNLLFTKTVYAYNECLKVDGSEISPDDFEQINQVDENLFSLINDTSFLSINSPVKVFFPSAQRHNIITYVVQEGDTPGKIAVDFGVSLNTILWANNLKANSIIRPNQELIILPVSGVLHKVKKGDTLLSISQKYKSSLDEIISFNQLKDESSLQIGQEIIVPHGKLPSDISLALSSGLKPMTINISYWPNLDNFYAYPTSGGWNRGILHYYNAVDIINSCGSPIYAAADGIVMKVSNTGKYNYGYGNLVKIQHYNSTLTVYAHLSDIFVKEGDKVYKGNLIGKMGDTGNANCCHLHFEVREAQNPFVKKK